MWKWAALLIFVSSPAMALDVRCDIKTKMLCDQTGCKPVPALGFNRLNIERKTFARCDRVGCSDFSVIVSTNAEFVTFTGPEQGIVAQMKVDFSTFHEVASFGQIIYLSFGTCRLDPR